MSMSGATELFVLVDPGPGATDDERDHLARELLGDIEQHVPEVPSAELVTSAEVPVGAKPAEAVTAGALLLAILPAAIPPLVSFLKDWVLRGDGRTVKIHLKQGEQSVDVEYDPAAMSPDDVAVVVERLREQIDADS